ncbi:o-succinylbenzoate synthase [Sansalvadorimonas verongulae]|uniref:o-succinylbenzoate synthase n=1 Tax=Sansalvadorimonas verongulae TaxID=2172824 RepID=UPI0012BC9A9C|nr:o-succinylbenzoate synthase [Sansalvadorimonas verongulae]MTI12808.1 o-succinylbenzoate synthase [Sansalvadorimonas verongulae]
MAGALSATVYQWLLPLTGTLPGCPQGERQGLLLWLERDGKKGLGDCAPLPGFSVETREQAAHSLVECAQWLVMQPDIERIQEVGLLEVIGKQPIPSSVVFAVEAAVKQLLSDTPAGRSMIPVCRLLAGSHDDIVQAAEELDSETRLVKIKVARQSVVDEIKLIQRLDSVLPERVKIRLDGNRGWNLKDALIFSRAIPHQRIRFIEEPLTDAEELPAYAASGGLPVALDESLQGTQTLPDYFTGLAALVVKPTLSGGVHRCQQLADFAHKHNLELVISSSYESPVGIGTLTRLALQLAPHTASGLDTLSIFQENRIPREQLHALWSSDQP